MKLAFITIAASLRSSEASPLEPIGKPIQLPFPNDQIILGVGGLGYHNVQDVWTACSENIASASAKESSDAPVSVT